MSQFSQANKKYIATLKAYAAEVLRQYEDKENEVLKAEKTLVEIKEMQCIYPEDEELLQLFESHSLTVERAQLMLMELGKELEAAKVKLKAAMNNRNKAASDVAMQTVEANMQAAGLELPRVSPVAAQMAEERHRQKLDALKAARLQQLDVVEQEIEPSDEVKEHIDTKVEKTSHRKPL